MYLKVSVQSAYCLQVHHSMQHIHIVLVHLANIGSLFCPVPTSVPCLYAGWGVSVHAEAAARGALLRALRLHEYTSGEGQLTVT